MGVHVGALFRYGVHLFLICHKRFIDLLVKPLQIYTDDQVRYVLWLYTFSVFCNNR